MKIREAIFKNFTGCPNHGCVVTGPKKGMGTNGGCSCLVNMNRSQLMQIQSRIQAIAERELPDPQTGYTLSHQERDDIGAEYLEKFGTRKLRGIDAYCNGYNCATSEASKEAAKLRGGE